MKLSDFYVTPENLPRIRALGYIRFVLFYSVIPVTGLLTIYLTAASWLTMHHTPLSNILDLFDIARDKALLAFPVSVVLGTLMWFVVLTADPNRKASAALAKDHPLWRLISFLVLGVLLGSAIGLNVGIWYHRERIAPWEDDQIAYGAAWYHELSARDLYLNGGYQDGKNALLDHIRVLQRIRDRHPGDTGFLVPESEIAFCYVRLSLLEQQHGNKEAAADFWQRASTQLQNLGWKDISRGKLLRALKARDNQLPTGVSEPSDQH